MIEVRRVVTRLCKVASNCEQKPFEDWLALDRSKFKYSPVYSVFNKRALAAIKNSSEDQLTASVKFRAATRAKGLPLITDVTNIGVTPPSVADSINRFRDVVERGYATTRNAFGALFDYETPSSSFLSLYISAGRVSIRQLMAVCSDATFVSELLWNQYCELFVEHYGDAVC